MLKFLVPLLLLFIFIYSAIKRVKLYPTFIEGAKKGIPMATSVFPYLVCIFILTELFSSSGLSTFFVKILSPVFNLFGIPNELFPLVLIKPFSGSGALATLSEIYSTYGVDSYLARSASVIYGSSETVFYILSVYFCSDKKHKLTGAVIISLFATFFSCAFACFICKVL